MHLVKIKQRLTMEEHIMEHQEGTFKGVRDLDIYYQAWLPEESPKACLVIVHGLAEHSGRYSNVVNHFLPLGYAVYGLDHPGHGRSQGSRTFVEHFDDFIVTLKKFFDLVDIWQPGLPVFLLGHSMGGLIGAVYFLDHQDELAGAILSGPAVKIPSYITPMTVFIGKLLSWLVPKFGLVQVDASGVSKDPIVVEAYENDPLVYRGKTTARIGAELLNALNHLSRRAAEIRLPLLILQGSEDSLVDLEGGQYLYDRVSSEDKTLKIYEGLYHEVYNEPEHDQVLRDVQVWLEAHLA
jgi:alpha-beta hydrolase superfamily lysophospholipase